MVFIGQIRYNHGQNLPDSYIKMFFTTHTSGGIPMLQKIANILMLCSFFPAVYSTQITNPDMVLASWVGYVIIMIAQLSVLKRAGEDKGVYFWGLIGDVTVVFGILIGGMKTIGLRNDFEIFMFIIILSLSVMGYLNKKSRILSQWSIMLAIVIVMMPGITYHWGIPRASPSTHIANGMAMCALWIQLIIEIHKVKQEAQAGILPKKWYWQSAMTLEWCILATVLEVAMLTWRIISPTSENTGAPSNRGAFFWLFFWIFPENKRDKKRFWSLVKFKFAKDNELIILTWRIIINKSNTPCLPFLYLTFRIFSN